MGDPTVIPTETEIENARFGIKFALERAQGDIEAFAENMVQVIAHCRAEARLAQNALHAREMEWLSQQKKDGNIPPSTEEES
jgi:hypothetical protein